MSTSGTRKGRRGRWALVGLLAACVGVFLSVGAGSASAAASCTFVSGPPGHEAIGSMMRSLRRVTTSSSFGRHGGDIFWSGSTGLRRLRASTG